MRKYVYIVMFDEMSKSEKLSVISIILSAVLLVAVSVVVVGGGSIFDQSVEANLTQECMDSEDTEREVCSYTVTVTEFGGNDELYVEGDQRVTPDSNEAVIEGLGQSETIQIYSESEQPNVDGSVYVSEKSYSIQTPETDTDSEDEQERVEPTYTVDRTQNPDGSGENITVTLEELNDASQLIVTSEGGSINVSENVQVEDNEFAENGSVARLYESGDRVSLTGVPYNSTLTIEYVNENGREISRELVVTEVETESGS